MNKMRVISKGSMYKLETLPRKPTSVQTLMPRLSFVNSSLPSGDLVDGRFRNGNDMRQKNIDNLPCDLSDETLWVRQNTMGSEGVLE
jgi:hypothetical protein